MPDCGFPEHHGGGGLGTGLWLAIATAVILAAHIMGVPWWAMILAAVGGLLAYVGAKTRQRPGRPARRHDAIAAYQAQRPDITVGQSVYVEAPPAPVVNVTVVNCQATAHGVACEHGAQEPAGREALRGRGVIPAIEAASVVPAVVLGEQEKVQR